MCQRFLCNKHRHALHEDADTALATWSKGINTGRENFDLQRMGVATVCFGGALEAAEILLVKHQDQSPEIFYKLSMAAMFLARSQYSNGQQDCAQTSLTRCSKLITDAISLDGFNSIQGLDCLSMLSNCYSALFENGVKQTQYPKHHDTAHSPTIH
ncbi:MAG: hypothetical protein OQK12_04160 [Motiliproteus sp.]|nr:hypothetical protein [Motiliproteus sp.]MCW9053349.1 hypothetical protein [Motiliproteus sp.]